MDDFFFQLMISLLLDVILSSQWQKQFIYDYVLFHVGLKIVLYEYSPS